MKKLLIAISLLLTFGAYGKGGTHPEFDMLDKDGNPIEESGKPYNNTATCGDCHDASENLDYSSDYILKRNMHPKVPLRDAAGKLVKDTGDPLSLAVTCGMCHDVNYINNHSDHANAGYGKTGIPGKSHSWAAGKGFFGGWNLYDYDRIDADEEGGPDVDAWLTRYGGRHVGGGPAAESVEMNCLLCHTTTVGLDNRVEQLAEEEFDWANSALLINLGLLTNDDGDWSWNEEAFDLDGSAANNQLPIQKPTDENCGACHGVVDNNLEKPLLLPDDITKARTSILTGQVFSPQKLNITGLNISGKEDLSRPFDVHAARVVSCVNCHYSLNNPSYYQRFDENQPAHLEFDPRRLTITEYIKKPLHQFAKGSSSQGLASVTENSLRRCESCHKEESIHDWLPYKERHFVAVACESCHIPELYAPTLKSVDWTLPDPEGNPVLEFRNSTTDYAASDNLLTKFVPVLLPRENVGGAKKLAPYNLVTGWYWLAGEEDEIAPIARETLIETFTDGSDYNEDILELFDTDQDGILSDVERRLDSEEKIALLTAALEEAEVVSPRLVGETTTYEVSHNVVNGKWATRDCQDCHHYDSLVDATIALASYSPGGITPEFLNGHTADMGGSIEQLDSGEVVYRADANASGFYILGLDSVPLFDLLGMLMFFGVSLGVTAHAIARKIASSRRGPSQHKYRKEYIYDAYERMWHWLQAGSILILLITGLIIHKPHLFGIFSFAYMVEVHNIVGFILLANAALALFYNLASGEIKQYLPEPKGFIGRSMAQAMYYSKGVFEGAPHPQEKSREQKMNPLQQVTYLAILNILLPVQVITGVLIWGAQRWPEIADSLGGLTLLAPIHTLAAWAFAAFIVMHVYLTTHGHTPTAGIKSMMTGWDDVEDNGGSHEEKAAD